MQASYASVHCIDILCEFASTAKTPMLTARCAHGAVYYDNYLYAIGGQDYDNRVFCINACERFEVNQEKWEALEPLPIACYAASVITLDESHCLYALGGTDDYENVIDLIQRLNLSDLSWDILELKLPTQSQKIASFKLDESQVFFVISKSLYSFRPMTGSMKVVKALARSTRSEYGPSHYNTGILHSSSESGYPYEITL
eukprot:CAMPEP_0204907568 /NCGR_PEP_ID=MMETSP1397-20131031/6690_1 /ASSEMBLY_ACC=CAM_ASM_000891 /TAXON_ID=49980 /ORGANISM="Climacostomum Climacostomum virens, Strain Stock W-24" /LENGTH=199 /DNA_ID=CAMNT_0052076767 /DNA_START=205 /DNA_END=804 /DNA_ORIENTATION=-